MVKHLRTSVLAQPLQPPCVFCWGDTYGGLLVRSVFRMTGTRVISVTSWMYSPPSSLSLNSFRYFSLLVRRASGISPMATLDSDRVRCSSPTTLDDARDGEPGTLCVGRSASDAPAMA